MDLFECCKHCVAPKRHPGCQDHCIDGMLAKAFSNVLRDERNNKSRVESDIIHQNQKNIGSAQRAHNRKFR